MADQKSYYADKTDFKNDLTGADGMAPYDGPVIYKGVIYTVSSDPGTGFLLGVIALVTIVAWMLILIV